MGFGSNTLAEKNKTDHTTHTGISRETTSSLDMTTSINMQDSYEESTSEAFEMFSQEEIRSVKASVGPAPAVPQYISLDEAMTQETEQDEDRMKKIRRCMAVYFGLKTQLNEPANKHDKQAIYEEMMKALEAVDDACYWYRFFTFGFFKEKRKRRAEVKALREQIVKEREGVQKDYITYLDTLKDQLRADEHIEKRADADPGIPEVIADQPKALATIKLKDRSWGKRALDLSAGDNSIPTADHIYDTTKNYIVIRAGLDLKRNDIDFSPEERAIIEKLSAYGKIRTTSKTHAEKRAGFHFIDMFSAAREMANEVTMYKQLLTELRSTVASLSEDEKKQAVFRAYLERLETFSTGGLTLTDEEKAQAVDCTGYTGYLNSGPKKDANGNFTYAERSLSNPILDYKASPLFSHPPCTADVVQGGMGDCFLLSSITALVAENPDAIRDMIAEDGDQLIVRFFHPTEAAGEDGQVKTEMKPVYIRIDRQMSALCAGGPLWVKALCKAYACYLQTFTDNGVQKKYEPDSGSAYAGMEEGIRLKGMRERANAQNKLDYGFISNGGYADDVLLAFTGRADIGEQHIFGTLLYEQKKTYGDMLSEIYQNRVTRENRKRMEADGSMFDQPMAAFIEDGLMSIYLKGYFDEYLKRYDNVPDAPDAATILKENRVFFKMVSACAHNLVNACNVRPDETDVLAAYGQKAGDVLNIQKNNERLPQGFLEMVDFVAEGIGKTQDECFAMLKEYTSACLAMVSNAKSEIKNDNTINRIFTGEYADEALALYDKIATLVNAGKPVVGDTREGTGKKTADGESKDAGMIGKHAYSILGVQEMLYEGKRIKMIKVRNPWAHYGTSYVRDEATREVKAVTKDVGQGGVFWMELTHFYRAFTNVRG